MTDWKERIHEEIEDLRRVRDELRVQVQLGKAEVNERWGELEKQWDQLEGKGKLLRDESKESLHEIGEATKLLTEEIRKGFKHIRDLL